MSANPETASRTWVPAPAVCRRYGVSDMTLWRWTHNPTMGFPTPVRMNRRRYFDAAELDAWDARLAAQREPASAAA